MNTFSFPYISSDKEAGDGGLKGEKRKVSMQPDDSKSQNQGF